MQKTTLFFLIFFALSSAQSNLTAATKAKPNFILNFLDSSIKEVRWCGKTTKEILLALTEKGSVYRSSDKGFTWKKINDLIYKISNDTNEKAESVGEVQSFLFSPADPELVIFQGSKGVNWLSEDCGNKIKAMDNGRTVNEFQFHPFERNWVLAAAWTICDDFIEKPCLIYKELFVSFDLGQNWVLIEDYVVQFSWAALEPSFVNIPKARIILAHDPEGKGHQKTNGWNEKVHLSYSDDFFKTYKVIVQYGNKFLLSKNYFFVAYVVSEETQDVSLVVSEPQTPNYRFIEVKMPMRRVKEHSYTILDTSEGRIFIHINHLGEKAKFGNIYMSDSTGTRFSLSIKNNVRDIEGQCDFEKIPGLNGIYISNIYDEKKVEIAKGAENTQIPFENFESNYQKRHKERSIKVFQELDSYVRTMISFDMGGIWGKLNAPTKDSLGKKVTCKDDKCSLHLNGPSKNMYGPVYAVESSIGLIMATGNVGYYLASRGDSINTYLSRDGGLTWFEVAKGSHIYEFGDHGGIIVMASDQEATTNISYSWNEGATWESLQISDTPFEITNIIIEPTNTAQSFVVYGVADNTRGLVVGIDFSSLHKRNCQGIESPDDFDSDYELWSPNDEANPKCLMGKRVTYLRRKREAECFNTQQFERKMFIENCECTEEDWECDLGYERKGNGPCTEIKTLRSVNQKQLEEPENCSHYYFISQGYRKVAGDTCVNGVDHSPIKIPCLRNSQLNSSNIYILVIISVLIGLILVFGTENRFKKWMIDTMNRKNDENGQRFEEIHVREKNFDGENLMEEKAEKNDLSNEFEHTNEINDQDENAHGKKFAERNALADAKKNIPNIAKPHDKNETKKDLI